MFGWRRRKQAAAEEAAREAERRAIMAKLAERPEHICPFLGLEGERAGYVDGISDEHRCFAFGDPGRLSSEQQTRVCQEPGYGNCPRYLRGVLVIPTEELEALRRPRDAAPVPPPPPVTERRRRRGLPVVALIGVLLLLVAGGIGAFLVFGDGFGTAIGPSPTPTFTPRPTTTADGSPATTASPPPSPAATASGPSSPAPEATPEADDTFAFYEVSLAPGRYTLYAIAGDGSVGDERSVPFDGYSFARVEPIEANDARIYWLTQDGGLTGYGYRYPDSGDFRIRAVFLTDAGERRSEFLGDEDLDQMPEGTPAP